MLALRRGLQGNATWMYFTSAGYSWISVTDGCRNLYWTI